MKKTFLIFSILILVVLTISINILANLTLSGVRKDLTEEKLYTLTDGTKNIISSVEEPITLKFYYSRDLIQTEAPGLIAFSTRVEELLKEYSALGGDKVRLEYIEPEPFSEEEDEAALAGVEGVPANSAGDLLFFGLEASNTVDDKKVIQFFTPEREAYLEYDLTEIIYNLTLTKKPTIGLLTDLPMAGVQANPMMQFQNPNASVPAWMVYSQIQSLYKIETVDGLTPIQLDVIDVLLVVHPRDLPEIVQYNIDQFVLKGGRAMVFVDPYAEIEEVPTDPQNPMSSMFADKSSSLGLLGNAWGLNLTSGEIVGDKENAQRVSVRNDRGLAEPVDYVGLIGLKPDTFADDITLASLSQPITFVSAGELVFDEEKETTITPLLQTSEQTDLYDADDIKISPNPNEMLENFESDQMKRSFAVRVSGRAKSAFPGGLGSTEEATAQHIEQAEEDINIIIVSDVDMLSDRLWVQVQNFMGQRMAMPYASNSQFVLNSIENLTGNPDLISIRSRGVSARPFTVVEEIRKDAEEQYRNREQELSKRLEEISAEISLLQQNTEGESLNLTTELQDQLDKANIELVEARKELRSVRKNLDKDVKALGNKLKMINILAMPGLVILIALLVGAGRAHKRRRTA